MEERSKVFGVGGENAVWVDGDICSDASKALHIELPSTSYSSTLTPNLVNGKVIYSELQSWDRRGFRLVVEHLPS